MLFTVNVTLSDGAETEIDVLAADEHQAIDYAIEEAKVRAQQPASAEVLASTTDLRG